MNPLPATTPKGLIRKIIFRLVVGQSLFGLLLFGGAGTFHFWQAWLFMGWSLGMALVFCAYFYVHDREVLARRFLTKEKIGTQKKIIILIKATSTLAYLLAGMDHRFGWTRREFGPVLPWISILALLPILAGYVLFFAVVNANRFAASVIQTEAGQTVISTGPYRWVRHPMYLSSAFITLPTPVTLGSLVAIPLYSLIILLLVMRLLHEEQTLRRELPGYADYCQRTRYRLIPFLW